jgi:hypothetical protein
VGAYVSDTTPSGEARLAAAPKTILVVWFSQSGQLTEILDRLLAPLRARPATTILQAPLKPTPPFPFPWSPARFLDVFPESFHEIPHALAPLGVDPGTRADLVILGYTPWYLSPAIPVSSFLQSAEGQALVAGRTVITVVGCRNMWYRAHVRVKTRLEAAGAHLKGHIVLADRAPNLVSAASLLHWMRSGRKQRLFGVLPLPGVSDDDIARAVTWGSMIAAALHCETFPDLKEKLASAGACRVVPHLISLENAGARVFRVWSWIVLAAGRRGSHARRAALVAFGCYLGLGLLLASPISFLLFYLTLPFRRRAIEREVKGVVA